MAPKLDHKTIGLKQGLFFFDSLHSQGSCFFEPRGVRIYNKLVEFLRDEYKKRNYDEVITPNIYNCQLWKTSGHWQYYKDNMIRFDVSSHEYSLKPMNCPGHCLMFKKQPVRRDDELPVRWADFGVLHRNELSGSLMGLTRVRRFQQDDAHIFCTPRQVQTEVKDCLSFASTVYKQFGFDYDVKLSLRPKEYLGSPELWDSAEHSLRAALDEAQVDWTEQKFEGAFYGPKIDLAVKDSHDRSQQCATIQLDFQLPERFDLLFKDSASKERQRPVIIHRAILGSIERFIAMIAENCSGRWPFWLSPLQAQVIPIHPNLNQAARKICDEFRRAGLWVDADLRDDSTLNAKIREAQLLPYNIVMVVGERELKSNSVNVRLRSAAGSEAGSPAMANPRFNIPIGELKQKLKEFERLRLNDVGPALLAQN